MGLPIYQQISLIQNDFVIAAAEVGAYCEHWSKDYSIDRLSSLHQNKSRMRENAPHFDYRFTIKDLQGLTPTELFSLGFRQWDNDFSFMIPLYLLNYLEPEDEYKCISGGVEKVKDFDDDHRYGCLAYFFNLV